MTTEQFTYWLQWFAEVNTKAPTEEQWTIIKDHLALVFDKQTPNRVESTPFVQPLDTRWFFYEKKAPFTPPYTVTCSTKC